MKDLFISHASEDKDDFVRPLANLLSQYEVDVWYDEFELRIGKSLSASIDDGIRQSNFGLIVLSKSFFDKNWTKYELKSLNSFEIDNNDVLLPIWKEVSVEEVRGFSPYLADKFALNTSNQTIEEIALKIIEVVKPDLFQEIHRKIALELAYQNSEVRLAKPGELKIGPIRHIEFTESTLSRIRLIRASLWLGYPHSMKYWIDGFRRDLNFETEIQFWERIGSCYLEILTQQELEKYHLGDKEFINKNLFTMTLEVSMRDLDYYELSTKLFQKALIDITKEIWRYNMPVYDIEDEFPDQ